MAIIWLTIIGRNELCSGSVFRFARRRAAENAACSAAIHEHVHWSSTAMTQQNIVETTEGRRLSFALIAVGIIVIAVVVVVAAGSVILFAVLKV